jgi:hypothetical protein
MHWATEKRELKTLVIKGNTYVFFLSWHWINVGCLVDQGKFKKPAAADGGKAETMVEMAALLPQLEREKIDVVPNTAEGKAGVLGDEYLEMLLDRSPKVFADRGQGWTSTDGCW